MADKRLYQNNTDVMLASFIQSTDPMLDTPNQVLPGKLWIDITNNGWVWKRRNADNTAWITKSDTGGLSIEEIEDALNQLVGTSQGISKDYYDDPTGVNSRGILTFYLGDNSIETRKLKDGAITYSKMQSVGANRLLGRGSNAGTPQEIALGENLFLENGILRAGATSSPSNTTNTTITGAANYIAASQFPNSLQDAINASANKTLLIDVDRTITTATIIPANVLLRFINSARITKGAGSTGSLAFGGIGYADDNPYAVYFDGFAEGDITFTSATNYKHDLVAQNFGAASLSQSLRIADKAVLGRHAELFAFPGTFTGRFDLTDKHTLYLSEGEFRNTFDGIDSGTSGIPAIVLHNDTRLVGAGMTRTIVYESTTSPVSSIAFATSVLNPNANGKNHNIEISDIQFRNSTYNAINQAYSAVSTGNATNGHIRRCYFLGLRGFGAYIGGNADVFGHFPEDSSITDSVFHNSAQNSVGAINGKNILIARNLFAKFGGYTMRRLDGITTAGSKVLQIASSNNIEINGATNVGGFRNDMTAQFGLFGPNFVILTYPDGTKSRTIPITSRQSDLQVTLDEALTKTATGVQVDVVVGSTLAMDFEPLGGKDVLDRMIVVDNVVDARDSLSSSVFGIKLQSPATSRGVTNSIISRNLVTGDDNSYGGRNIRLTVGIEVMNADNILISDNVVQGTVNAGYIIENGYQITLQNNIVAMAGAADDKAMILTALTESDIKGNIVRKTYSDGWFHSERIFEQELGLPVTIDADGITVHRTGGGGGYIFLPFWVGKKVTINNTVYTVAKILDVITLQLSTPATPSTTAIGMTTKFSDNSYFGNRVKTLRLAENSLSRVNTFDTTTVVGGTTSTSTPTSTPKPTSTSTGTLGTLVSKFNFGVTAVAGWTSVAAGSGGFDGFDGGFDYTDTVDVNTQTGAVDTAVYKTLLYKSTSGAGAASFTIPALTAGTNYVARIHVWMPAGFEPSVSHSWNIDINGGTAKPVVTQPNQLRIIDIPFTGASANVLNFSANTGGQYKVANALEIYNAA